MTLTGTHGTAAAQSDGPSSGGQPAHFWWGSVFLVTLPLAIVALAMAVAFVPSHVSETADPVDNLGGILSVRVAACAGMIVFGTLMGAMFIGQQFLQNVLGYSTLDAGLAILPAAVLMVLVAPLSARLVNARGARFTLLAGYMFCLSGFLVMLLLWKDRIQYWKIGLAYALVGTGVGLAGPPAARSLTASVPVDRAGMASGTADLQRDLGGAIMQSILGAILAVSYAAAMSAALINAPADDRRLITGSIVHELQRSYGSAADVAQRYPRFEAQITAAAKSAFLKGSELAHAAGIATILLGAVIVFFFFPKKDDEARLLAEYHAEDDLRHASATSSAEVGPQQTAVRMASDLKSRE